MKIFFLQHIPPKPEKDPRRLPLALLPDTAITPKGMPVFLPDFATEGWEFHAVAALRIGRLGKSIPRKFAHRYIDGMTLGALLLPSVANTALPSPVPFDSALTLGAFIGPAQTFKVSFGSHAITPEGIMPMAEAAVEAVSAFSTLRTGDLLILPLPATIPAAINLQLPMEINGTPVGLLRVK